ncbi:MAG: thioredoxin domain-containing protein [Gammaproteobacteria bacterium]|nr:thioredoxin domain-containing protein [Gammaproteobacteria bacterium]
MKTLRTFFIHLTCVWLYTMALQPALAADRPLFRYNGFEYIESELSLDLRQLLHEADIAHYKKVQQVIDGALLDVYFTKESERLGKSKEALILEHTAVEAPDEKTLRAFYNTNKKHIKGSYEKVRKQLENYLRGQKMQEKRQELLASLKENSDFEMRFVQPIAPYVEIDTKGFPAKGSAKPKVTFVEFADYRCPHCKHASEALKSLAERYHDEIRVVYMDFPVLRGAVSRIVAEGGVCADKQGKFWAYHDMAYARQEKLNNKSPFSIAASLGLDEKAFKRCLDSPEPGAKTARSKKEGARLGISSTPTIYANGRRLHLQNMKRDLLQTVKDALKKQ